MAKKFWWPTSLADQLVLVQNFQNKIDGYAVPLGLTPAQVSAAQDLCDGFVTAFTFHESAKTTMQSVTQWRDEVFYGTPTGDPAGAPPVFAVAGAPAISRGVVTQLFELRDLIVAAPGYTEAIGEDLGIVGAEKADVIPELVAPDLKPSVASGYTVNLKGSMQGMTGMRVEYRRAGGDFTPVAFLTNLPGSFQIAPAAPGQPESGEIRAVFIRKNAEFGNWSPNYPVTVS